MILYYGVQVPTDSKLNSSWSRQAAPGIRLSTPVEANQFPWLGLQASPDFVRCEQGFSWASSKEVPKKRSMSWPDRDSTLELYALGTER